MSNAPIERHDDGACEVPFVEQLRSVPDKCRLTLEIQWAEDGTATGHQFIPVGFMMHRAAAEIESLEACAMRWYKAASPYATPEALAEALAALIEGDDRA